MAQGALGAAGVRRVGYGLEVGRSVRTAGGAGHRPIVLPRAQLVITNIHFLPNSNYGTGAMNKKIETCLNNICQSTDDTRASV